MCPTGVACVSPNASLPSLRHEDKHITHFSIPFQIQAIEEITEHRMNQEDGFVAKQAFPSKDTLFA